MPSFTATLAETPALLIALAAAAAIAIRYRHIPTVRRVFAVSLVLLFLSPILISSPGWPVLSWAVFGSTGPTDATVHEVRLVDENGSELQYDARAIGTTDDGFRGKTERLVTARNTTRLRAFGTFLLDRGHAYRDRVASRALGPPWIQAPRKQMDYRWDQATLREYDRFTAVRVYRIEATIAQNGTRIPTRTETPVVTINETDVRWAS